MSACPHCGCFQPPKRESPKQIAKRILRGIPPTPVFQDEKKPVEGAITISTILRRAA